MEWPSCLLILLDYYSFFFDGLCTGEALYQWGGAFVLAALEGCDLECSMGGVFQFSGRE